MAKRYIHTKDEQLAIDESTATSNASSALTGTIITMLGRLLGRTKDIMGTSHYYSDVPISLQELRNREIETTAPLGGGGDLSADLALSITAASDTDVGVVRRATDSDITSATAGAIAVPPDKLRTYGDNLTQILDHKNSVRATTTTALAANTGSGSPQNVLTANANGALGAQDGITLVVGESILVKDEATGSKNGIYVVTAVGGGSAPYVLTRRSDADSSAKFSNAAEVRVEAGSLYAGSKFYLANTAAITLGTTALSFVAQSTGGGGGSAGPASAGTLGIVKTDPEPDDAANPFVVGTNDADYLSIPYKSQFADRYIDHVTSGINPSVPGSGLDLTIPSGVAYALGRRMAPGSATRTYTASRDTYVDLVDDGSTTGSYSYLEVTNNASEPALTGNAVRVLKVVTGASAIASVGQRSRLTSAKRCRVTKNANQTISSANTVAAVSWQTDVDDPLNWHDPTTNNTRITPGETGWYLVCRYTVWLTNNNGARQARLAVNGTAINDGDYFRADTTTSNQFPVARTEIVSLDAQDYLELQVQSSQGGVNLSSASYMMVTRLL